MSNSNVLDLLLATDVSKIVKPKKQVEIKRLSSITGGKVIFTCQGLNSEEINYIVESSKKQSETDGKDILRFYVVESVKDPDFKNKDLMEKYKALTPIELVDKMLLPGEISQLYDVISELSGFGKNAVEEVKNE